MGRLDWSNKFPEPDEKKSGPRNWDSCWTIDTIDENGVVMGERMTCPPFDRLKFYALKKGTIKVFPEALVLITTTSDYHFGGILFLGAAVYDEQEIVTSEQKDNNGKQP